jgi:hypothetical protein
MRGDKGGRDIVIRISFTSDFIPDQPAQLRAKA